MRRFAHLAVCLTLACGPGGPPAGPPVYLPRLQAVVAAYRDRRPEADAAWTGRRVRAALPADAYGAGAGAVTWALGPPGTPPAVVFRLAPGAGVPPGRPAVAVVGVCRGARDDGLARGHGVGFVVEVVDCEVAPASP
jgi:hypothetical protein